MPDKTYLVAGVQDKPEGADKGIYLFNFYNPASPLTVLELKIGSGQLQQKRNPHSLRMLRNGMEWYLGVVTRLGIINYGGSGSGLENALAEAETESSHPPSGSVKKSSIAKKWELPFEAGSSLAQQHDQKERELLQQSRLHGTFEQVMDKVYLNLFVSGSNPEERSQGISLVEFTEFFSDTPQFKVHQELKGTAPLCISQGELIVPQETRLYNFARQEKYSDLKSPIIATASLDDVLCCLTADYRYHLFSDGQGESYLQGELPFSPHQMGLAQHKGKYYLVFTNNNSLACYGIEEEKSGEGRKVKQVNQHSFFKEPYFKKEELSSIGEKRSQGDLQVDVITNLLVTPQGWVIFTIANRIFRVAIEDLIKMGSDTDLPFKRYETPHRLSGVGVYKT